MQKNTILHPQYGKIELTINPRARRIIMRARPDALHITIPPVASISDIEKALATQHDKLQKLQEATKQIIIKCGYTLHAPNFNIEVQESVKERLILHKIEKGRYLLLYPESKSDKYVEYQQMLRKTIIRAMQHCAKELLPKRLSQLASKHKFKYNSVSVRNSRTRWGSCSNRGNISLSSYLVLLSDKLIDYVLLHELCHTVEMNHSPRFWQLLDTVCNGEAKILRKELRSYKTDF